MRKEGIIWLAMIPSLTFQLGLLKPHQGTGLSPLKACSNYPGTGWIEKISITSFHCTFFLLNINTVPFMNCHVEFHWAEKRFHFGLFSQKRYGPELLLLGVLRGQGLSEIPWRSGIQCSRGRLFLIHRNASRSRAVTVSLWGSSWRGGPSCWPVTALPVGFPQPHFSPPS